MCFNSIECCNFKKSFFMKYFLLIFSVIFMACDTCDSPVGNGGDDSAHHLYFTALPLGSESFNVYRADENGNNITEILQNAYSYSPPSFNNILAFVRKDENSLNELIIYNINSGNIQEIDKQNSLFDIINPMISSNGKYIAFLGGAGKLFVYNIQEGILELLSGSLLSGSICSFSPDGKKIAYFERDNEIKMIVKNTDNPDNNISVTNFSGYVTDSKFTLIPKWSDDSEIISFSLFDDEYSNIIISDIYGNYEIIKTKLNEIKAYNPAVNTSKNHIAFNSANGNIWLCENISNPLFFQLTENNDVYYNSNPVWSPDERMISFIAKPRDAGNTGNLILLSLDDNDFGTVSKKVIVSNNCFNYYWK
jgi:Tol biopolymer transport system component